MTARVLHVLSDRRPSGAATQLRLLGPGLTQAGFEVHVCALNGPNGSPHFDIGHDESVAWVRRSSALDPIAFSRLCRQVRRLHPHLVQTWGYPANTLGIAAAIAAGAGPVVCWNPGIGVRPTLLQRAIDRVLARRSRRIVVTTQEAHDVLIERGMPKEKLIVIPCAVTPAASISTSTSNQLRTELGLPAHARIIGAAVELVSANRIKDLIWAADLLKVLYDDVHLLIMGEGPQRWRLQRFCRQVEIEDRVHFLGPRPDAQTVIAHLDCFWAADTAVGNCRAILAAMAAGVPIIAVDRSAPRGLVIPNQTAFLYPEGNRAALARLTRRLLDQPALARAMGEAGRQRAIARFDTKSMVQQYVAMYQSVLDREPAPSASIPPSALARARLQ